jgi:hypothetical protein
MIHLNIFESPLNVHTVPFGKYGECAQFCSAYFMNMHSLIMFKDLHSSRTQRNRTDLLSKFCRCAQSTESYCAVIQTVGVTNWCWCIVVHIFSLVQAMPLRPVGLERGVFLDAVG